MLIVRMCAAILLKHIQSPNERIGHRQVLLRNEKLNDESSFNRRHRFYW